MLFILNIRTKLSPISKTIVWTTGLFHLQFIFHWKTASKTQANKLVYQILLIYRDIQTQGTYTYLTHGLPASDFATASLHGGPEHDIHMAQIGPGTWGC